MHKFSTTILLLISLLSITHYSYALSSASAEKYGRLKTLVNNQTKWSTIVGAFPHLNALTHISTLRRVDVLEPVLESLPEDFIDASKGDLYASKVLSQSYLAQREIASQHLAQYIHQSLEQLVASGAGNDEVAQKIKSLRNDISDWNIYGNSVNDRLLAMDSFISAVKSLERARNTAEKLRTLMNPVEDSQDMSSVSPDLVQEDAFVVAQREDLLTTRVEKEGDLITDSWHIIHDTRVRFKPDGKNIEILGADIKIAGKKPDYSVHVIALQKPHEINGEHAVRVNWSTTDVSYDVRVDGKATYKMDMILADHSDVVRGVREKIGQAKYPDVEEAFFSMYNNPDDSRLTLFGRPLLRRLLRLEAFTPFLEKLADAMRVTPRSNTMELLHSDDPIFYSGVTSVVAANKPYNDLVLADFVEALKPDQAFIPFVKGLVSVLSSAERAKEPLYVQMLAQLVKFYIHTMVSFRLVNVQNVATLDGIFELFSSVVTAQTTAIMTSMLDQFTNDTQIFVTLTQNKGAFITALKARNAPQQEEVSPSSTGLMGRLKKLL